MVFVKYVDLVSDNLIDNRHHFVKQLMREKYEDLSFSCLSAIARVIAECFDNERWQIHLDLMKETASEKRIVEGKKRMLKAFKHMELLKDREYPAKVAQLAKRTPFYEDLLHLFGNIHSPRPENELVTEFMFPESYRGNENKAHQVAKEIFDLIRDATLRSMSPKTEGDISKEEWAATTSNDRGLSLRKKIALKKLEMVQEYKELQKRSNNESHTKKHVSFSNENGSNSNAKANKRAKH